MSHFHNGDRYVQMCLVVLVGSLETLARTVLHAVASSSPLVLSHAATTVSTTHAETETVDECLQQLWHLTTGRQTCVGSADMKPSGGEFNMQSVCDSVYRPKDSNLYHKQTSWQ